MATSEEDETVAFVGWLLSGKPAELIPTCKHGFTEPHPDYDDFIPGCDILLTCMGEPYWEKDRDK